MRDNSSPQPSLAGGKYKPYFSYPHQRSRQVSLSTAHRFFFLFVGLWLLSLQGIHAQALDHHPGQLILHLPKGQNPEILTQEYAIFEGKETQFKLQKTLCKSPNIFLYSFDYQEVNEIRFLREIRDNALVLQAQFNHLLQARNTWPNDPYMDFQWHWLNTGGNMGLLDADIDADLAWDITTGGLTPEGREIVIALLDDGLDLQHEDFQGNYWVNTNETLNGIDDDGNGYVDDRYGWNIISQNDYIGYGTHGTQVAGLMGARGDNGLGVSGLNWQVKIMPIVSNWTEEADVVAGYGYVLSNRRLYNQTNGEKGAFVVATNLSWGVDGVPASEAPIWCTLYDSLGTVGILNIGATTNTPWDVDQVGDLPTGCTSDYFLGVTASNQYDELAAAGYGQYSVDLAAPGVNIFTTQCCNQYQFSSGTSFAAPQVTALAALLYSAPCPFLEELSMQDPAAAVQWVKESILQGVDPVSSMDGLTATGGRLNAYKSMLWLLSTCSSCAPPPTPTITSGDENGSLLISWGNNPNDSSGVNIYYRKAGEPAWEVLYNQYASVQVYGLDLCSKYEFKISRFCPTGQMLFSPIAGAQTEGCCQAPEEIRFEPLPDDAQTLRVSWDPAPAAVSYKLQYRLAGEDDWQEEILEDTSILISNLNPCSVYEWKISTQCENLPTPAEQNIQTFSLPECESCTSISYCIPSETDNSIEWIEKVRIDNWLMQSGAEETGYALQNSEELLLLRAGESHNISVLAGSYFSEVEEIFRLWIDFNQDGDFQDQGELLWAPPNPAQSGIWQDGSFELPDDLPKGYYRMRLCMWWAGNPPAPTEQSCPTQFVYGEIEDYCVFISRDYCLPAENIDITAQDEQSVLISWESNPTTVAQSYRLLYWKEGENLPADTVLIPHSNNDQWMLEGLIPCQAYTFSIETLCQNESTSSEQQTFYLQGECEEQPSMQVFPNPFDQQLLLYLSHTAQQERVELNWYAPTGAWLYSQRLSPEEGQSELSVATEKLPEGLLFLQVKLSSGEVFVTKVFKNKQL